VDRPEVANGRSENTAEDDCQDESGPVVFQNAFHNPKHSNYEGGPSALEE
jgi:hypothetical protein